MRVLFFIPRMGSGGAERVISILANEFESEGNCVHIAQLINSESFYQLNENVTLSGMDIKIRRNTKLIAYWDQARFFFKGVNYIKNEIRKFRPDIVISFMRQTCIMMWVAKLTGCKVKLICSERNDPTVQSTVTRKLMKKVFSASDLLVCQGQGVSNYFSNVKNKVIIPNPVADRNNIFVPYDQRRKAVSAVGRLDKQKNFALLIRSFVRVHDKYPEYKLEIYGEGPERESLTNLIKEKRCENYVTLMGSHKNVQEKIADTELFIMSSDYEGFPNALAEAMSIGLPVISTDFYTGAAKEMIREDCGLLVPVGDEDSMVGTIEKMLRSGIMREQFARNCIGISNRYSVKNIVDRWKDAISKCLEGETTI